MTTTLTYFDFDASRGLECRLALTVAGVDFQDNRIGRAQWAELKPTVPYGALPVLTMGGKELAQSTAILNAVGRAHGLLPTDAWAAAEHDAIMHSVEDIRAKVPGRGLSDEDKRIRREEFAAGWLTRWAETVSARIQGPFVEGEAISVADIKLYVILRAIFAGVYDYIPGSTLDDWPALGALVEAVDAHPVVVAYWASRKG